MRASFAGLVRRQVFPRVSMGGQNPYYTRWKGQGRAPGGDRLADVLMKHNLDEDN